MANKQKHLLEKVSSSLFDKERAVFHHPLVLMVSGGSDSTALLHAIHQLFSNQLGDTTFLQVLHVNHLLRGEDSDADERFVRSLCEALQVSCRVERVEIAALASRQGISVEQAGRLMRYKLAEETLASLEERTLDAANDETGTLAPSEEETLGSLKEKVPYSCSAQSEREESHANRGCILTAHTADDRAETLLQRLIVGGGSGSLASIPQRNGRVLRPMLECTRQELRDWLTELAVRIDGFLWREDATNLDTQYSRAFVRHTLLPLLAERNPRILEGLNHTADVLTCESEWLEEQASELLPLTNHSFSAPLPLLRRAVYIACTQAIAQISPGARITYEHIDLITREGASSGFACQIPGGIQVRNERGTLKFSKALPPKHDPRKGNTQG